MISPTSSAAKHQGPLSMIARRWRPFPHPHLRRNAALPPPSTPAFRKDWKEVAPGQWQVLHIDGEADQNK